MAFWKKKKSKKQAGKAVAQTGPRRTGKRTPLELKLAAMDGLSQGLNAREVADLIGVSDASVYKWRKVYEKEGAAGLRRKASSPAVKRRCEALEARIIARREEKPDAGVRRIRDELRREEGLEVSAETVRQVVNEAGLLVDPEGVYGE
jgi:transposase